MWMCIIETWKLHQIWFIVPKKTLCWTLWRRVFTSKGCLDTREKTKGNEWFSFSFGIFFPLVFFSLQMIFSHFSICLLLPFLLSLRLSFLSFFSSFSILTGRNFFFLLFYYFFLFFSLPLSVFLSIFLSFLGRGSEGYEVQ